MVLTADALRFITAVPVQDLVAASGGDRSVRRGGRLAADAHSSWRTRRICCSLRPATANTIARLANGMANDALSCVALALNPHAKTLIAPAMNGKMWLHPATQQNVATLKSRGVEFIGPEEGLALLRVRRVGPAVAGGQSGRTRAGTAAAAQAREAAALDPSCLVMNVGLWQRLKTLQPRGAGQGGAAVARPGGGVVEALGARCGAS